MDWNRRYCARRGHLTYAPDEAHLRDHMATRTVDGELWQCVRCGDFTGGAPAASGPAADAPVVLRGAALRSRLIMRLLALERVFRFLLVGAIAYGVWRFANSQRALQLLFEKDLTVFRPVGLHWGYDLENSAVVATIRSTFTFKHSMLTIAALALAVYALIELIEAIGLWLAKRWGEYFAVVATALFLPVEVYELLDSHGAFKIATFVLNVAAVVYLVVAKRLFGVRGGGRAAEAAARGSSVIEEHLRVTAPQHYGNVRPVGPRPGAPLPALSDLPASDGGVAGPPAGDAFGAGPAVEPFPAGPTPE